MGRRVWLIGVWVLTIAAALHGQEGPQPKESMFLVDVAAHSAFEVATIKPSDANHSSSDSGQMGHRVAMSNTSVLFLLCFAYDLQEKQVVAEPEWVRTTKFDFSGVADIPGTPNLDQLKQMLQQLLVDRFALRFHREAREMPAYVLAVAKDGPKLVRSTQPGKGLPSLLMQPGFPKVASLKATDMSMTNFARLLQSGILNIPVVDRTGLTGTYEFLIRWTPDETQFTQAGTSLPIPGSDADAPPLSRATLEELGLTLKTEKRASVEVPVIDHVAPPSEN